MFVNEYFVFYLCKQVSANNRILAQATMDTFAGMLSSNNHKSEIKAVRVGLMIQIITTDGNNNADGFPPT